jgi:hypothetical protein
MWSVEKYGPKQRFKKKKKKSILLLTCSLICLLTPKQNLDSINLLKECLGNVEM